MGAHHLGSVVQIQILTVNLRTGFVTLHGLMPVNLVLVFAFLDFVDAFC